MRSKLFTIVFWIVITCGSIYATNSVDYEIITMFGENVVEMPFGASSASISDVKFKPDSIKQILLNYDAQTISKAFPDYNPADSLIVSPNFPRISVKPGNPQLAVGSYVHKGNNFPKIHLDNIRKIANIAQVEPSAYRISVASQGCCPTRG
jgi:hypothetical protein